jgi:cysteine desulfurase / selenocysteine lyase
MRPTVPPLGEDGSMEIDVERLRADTPGCHRVVHLNNAGAALPTRQVTDAVVEHLHLEAELGGYEAEAAARDRIDDTRAALAELFGVDRAHVALTTSDTVAWSKALWGLELAGWFDRGGRVLVDRASYNSHYLALLQVAERHDVALEVVAGTDDGTLDLDDLDRRLDPDVLLVSATHVGTHRGLVNPVAQVGARTRAAGVPFFLDACQSAGQLPVDLAAIGCDVATGTGRKFLRGPRGTGWLVVRPEWSERMVPPGIDGTSAEWTSPDSYRLADGARRFEEFETGYAARIGLGVAVRQTLALGIETIAARVGGLAEQLRDHLRAVGAEVHDGGSARCGIVTFTVPGIDSAQVRDRLAAARINVSVTAAPFAQLDMTQRGLVDAVRASPHVYNTADESAQLVEVVERAGSGSAATRR